MTTNFNPSATATSGIEWMPTRRLPKPLSNAQGIGAKVTSTAAETIASVRAFLAGATGTQVGLDIYDADDAYATVFGVLVEPAVDHADSGLWEQSSPSIAGGAFQPYEDATAPNGWNFVNEHVYDHIAGSEIDTAVLDKIRYAPTTGHLSGRITWQMGSTYYFANDNAGGAVPVNQRIARVQIAMIARNAGGKTATLDGWITLAGDPYGSDSGPISIQSAGAWTVYRFNYDYNPGTGLPWNNSDFAEFLSGGSNAFGARVDGPVGSDIVIGAVSIIFRMLPEKRVATGYVTAVPSGAGSYHTFAMRNPQDGSVLNWSKANATDYLYLFHLNKAGGVVSLVGVDDDGIAGGGLGGWHGATQLVTQTMIPTADDPVLSTWVPAMFHMTSAPALGADRQPYELVATQPVYTGVGNVRQGMAAHASADYGGIRVLLARPAVTPTAALIVRIRKVSDDSQVGGDVTILPADVVYNASGFALVTAQLASNASLLSGTSYYLAFTSASAATAPWQVCYVASDSVASTDGTTVAAGGIAGAATLAGTANALADILVNSQTAPTAPGSFTGAVAYLALSPAPPGGPTHIGYVALNWADTSLGANFGYYEVQRSNLPIAYITDESKSFFNDFEVRRGVARTYRVRVVRADGAASSWAT